MRAVNSGDAISADRKRADTVKLLGISGSPSVASKTLVALSVAVEHARRIYPDVPAEALSLRDFDMQFSDGREPSRYDGDTRVVIDKVLEAEALVVGTPMYRGSYTGSLKNLFDVLPNDALQGKPVGLIATGGTDHHFLAIEHELKPILGFFYAHPVPGAVYANNTHYVGGELVDEGVVQRLRQLAQAVVEFARHVPRAAVGPARPEIPRESLHET